jgi:H+/Cl- antiporter ClcA
MVALVVGQAHMPEAVAAVLVQSVPMGASMGEMVGLVYRLIYPDRLCSMQAVAVAGRAAAPPVAVLAGLVAGAMQEITQLV